MNLLLLHLLCFKQIFSTSSEAVVYLAKSGWAWTLSEDEQVWLASVLVLLWHFLETPGSCTERGLEGWWELQGTCGSASAAFATGA